MISEDQQDTAALYALGLLDAEEAAEFERAAARDPELGALVRELRDAAALAALEAEQVAPPGGLRAEVLARVAAEAAAVVPTPITTAPAPAPTNVVRGPWTATSWIPWAAAAALAAVCGVLWMQTGKLRTEVASLRQASGFTAPAERLQQIVFCELDPVTKAKPIPRVAIAWDAERREGVARLSHLDPPGEGKDYQLWVVEDGVKDPVSAGVMKVNPEGSAEAVFKPAAPGNQKAVAFALSVERAGGVTKNQGPIVMLGKL